MGYLPVDVIVNQKAKEKHEIDALNLLAYVVLLVLVVLTIWTLKRRRGYLHETGLAIIYGMIMGAAIRYIGLEIPIRSVSLEELLPNYNGPSDYVIVKARNLGEKNATEHIYAYEFRGELQRNAKLGSQISYASVDPEVFFNIILPPIVLNAGLSLKRRHFFRNIGAIFTYAFVGTTISVAIVGSFIYGAIHLLKSIASMPYLADTFSLSNCLYFGAIISPTDPLAVLAIFQELGVDVNLYALVFGESILNDAVSIVLTHSIDQFSIIYGRNSYYPIAAIIWECAFSFTKMFLASCLIGIIFGVLTSLTTKFTKLSDFPLLETSLLVLMSYTSFLTAEVLETSGIVAILLCGVTQAHYTINNLSFDARERIRNLFEMLTFLCENFLFLAVGVAIWQRNQTWDLWFIGISFVAVIIARALSVYPLSALLNLGRCHKIPASFQHVVAWGGGARGVISYSLAARNTVGDARRIMLSATTVIVIFSVISVGSSVDWMLRALSISFKHSNQSTKNKQNDTNDDKQQDDGRKQHQLQINNAHETGSLTTTDDDGQLHTCAPSWYLRSTHGRLAATTSSLGQQTPSVATTADSDAGHHRRPAVGKYRQQQHSVASTPVLQVDTVAGGRRCARCNLATDSVGSLRTVNDYQEDDDSDNDQDHNAKVRDSILNGNANQNDAPDTSNSGYENASLVRRWRKIDNNFIKPLLTSSLPTLMETLPSSLSGLARLLTSDEQLARRDSRL